MPSWLEASSSEWAFCVPQVNKANGEIRASWKEGAKNFWYLKVDVWSLSMKIIVWTTLQVQSWELSIKPPPPVNASYWYLYTLFIWYSFIIKKLLLLFLKSSRNATALFRDATLLAQECKYDTQVQRPGRPDYCITQQLAAPVSRLLLCRRALFSRLPRKVCSRLLFLNSNVHLIWMCTLLGVATWISDQSASHPMYLCVHWNSWMLPKH